MQTLPTIPSSVWQCVKLCFKAMPKTIRHNWLNYFVIVAINISTGLSSPSHKVLAVAVSIASLLIGWYFYSCYLYKANGNLLGNPINYKEAFANMSQRFLRVVGANIIGSIVILIFISPTFIVYFFTHNKLALAISFIVSLLLIVWFVFNFLFVLPSIVVDNFKVIPAFKHSFALVKNNWWRNFFVILLVDIFTMIIFGIIIAVVMILLADKPEVAGGIAYLLLLLYVPLLMTAIYLVQYNDLKLRYQNKQVNVQA